MNISIDHKPSEIIEQHIELSLSTRIEQSIAALSEKSLKTHALCSMSRSKNYLSSFTSRITNASLESLGVYVLTLTFNLTLTPTLALTTKIITIYALNLFFILESSS